MSKAKQISKIVDGLLKNLDGMLRVGGDWKLASPITPFSVHEAYVDLEVHGMDNKCQFVVMSPKMYVDVRKGMKGNVDIEKRTVYLKEFLVSKIWGATVVLKPISDKEILFFGSDGKSYSKGTTA